MAQTNTVSNFDVVGSDDFSGLEFYKSEDITIPHILEDYGINKYTSATVVFLTVLLLPGTLSESQIQEYYDNYANECEMGNLYVLPSVDAENTISMILLDSFNYLDAARYYSQRCPNVPYCNPGFIAVPQTNGCMLCMPGKGVIPMDPRGLNPEPRPTYTYPTPVPRRIVPTPQAPIRPQPTPQKVPNSQNG